MKDPLWEGVYSSFQEVPVIGPGFKGENWLHNSLSKTAGYRDLAQNESTVPMVTGYRESLLPVIAGLVYGRARRTRILDFGGGIGFSYFQVIKALPRIDGLEYHIVELEQVCREGESFFKEENNIVFHKNLPEYASGYFDIVHMGSSLQYVDHWQDLLADLCAYSPGYFLLSNIPAGDIPTYATAQNYHGSKIACWFFNVNEIIDIFWENQFELVFKSSFFTKIYGIEQPYPQENFDQKFRIQYPCILVFQRKEMK